MDGDNWFEEALGVCEELNYLYEEDGEKERIEELEETLGDIQEKLSVSDQEKIITIMCTMSNRSSNSSFNTNVNYSRSNESLKANRSEAKAMPAVSSPSPPINILPYAIPCGRKHVDDVVYLLIFFSIVGVGIYLTNRQAL